MNIAARLEKLAEPGGICISRVVHEEVRDKLPYEFEDMGEQSVKNIARPVRAFVMGSAAVAKTELVPILPLTPQVVTKASSLPEELSSQSIMGTQIRAYAGDATLIEKEIRYENKSVGYGKTREVRTDTIEIYTFELKFDKRHLQIPLSNRRLPFAIGVVVTFLCFSNKNGEEELFSVYNHSDPVWRRFPPYKQPTDLSNEGEKNWFLLLSMASFSICSAPALWFKAPPPVWFWMPLVLVFVTFGARDLLRRHRLKSIMTRLQEHVEFR